MGQQIAVDGNYIQSRHRRDRSFGRLVEWCPSVLGCVGLRSGDGKRLHCMWFNKERSCHATVVHHYDNAHAHQRTSQTEPLYIVYRPFLLFMSNLHFYEIFPLQMSPCMRR